MQLISASLSEMAEQIKILFGLNTPGGQWNIVLDGGPHPPAERGRGPVFNLGPPPVFGTAEARDLKFCVRIQGWGPTNCAKLDHRGSGMGSHDLILNFRPSMLSLEWLKLGTLNFACIQRGGGPKKLCKIGHGGSKAASPDLIRNFGIPLLSPECLKLQC